MDEKTLKYRLALRAKREMKELGFDNTFQLINSYRFYKTRVLAIEKIKNEIPEPVKTKIINILANGRAEL